MAYGFKAVNGRNVTVIDENTACASYRNEQFTYDQATTNVRDYYFNPIYFEKGIPCIQIVSNTVTLYMSPTSDTGGRILGTVGRLEINDSSIGLPDHFPLKMITSMDEIGNSSDQYGLRILNSTGGTVFDSGRKFAVPNKVVSVKLDRDFTLPLNCWVCPIASYMHWSGDWRGAGGFSKVSNDGTFRGDFRGTGGAPRPLGGELMMVLLVFDSLG